MRAEPVIPGTARSWSMLPLEPTVPPTSYQTRWRTRVAGRSFAGPAVRSSIPMVHPEYPPKGIPRADQRNPSPTRRARGPNEPNGKLGWVESPPCRQFSACRIPPKRSQWQVRGILPGRRRGTAGAERTQRDLVNHRPLSPAFCISRPGFSSSSPLADFWPALPHNSCPPVHYWGRREDLGQDQCNQSEKVVALLKCEIGKIRRVSALTKIKLQKREWNCIIEREWWELGLLCV